MKKIMIMICFVLITLTNHTFASEYISEGVGPTEKAAIQDSFRYAIENVIGLTIDSKTYANNNRIIRDQILSCTEGYIRNYTILETKNIDSLVHVKTKVTIDTNPNSELMTKLEKLKMIKVGINDPRIAIMIIDKDNYSKDCDEASENSIANSLKENGFSRIINLKQLNSISEERYKTAAFNQDYQTIAMLGTQQQVDYIITGTINTSKVNLKMNTQVPIKSCRSFIEVKTIKTETGEIVQSGQYDCSAVDITVDSSIETAKANVGKIAGNAIASSLIATAANNNKNYTIYIHGLKNINDAQEIERLLNDTLGVQQVYIRNFISDYSIIDINFNGDSQTLASYLNNLSSDYKININSVTNSSIDMNISINRKNE